VVETWTAKLGTYIGTHTERVMQTTVKSVNKAAGAISSWWYGKKKTARISSSPSSGRKKSTSEASSGEL